MSVLRSRACTLLILALILLLVPPPGLFSEQADDPRALYTRGMAQLEDGNFDDAYTSLARAYELDGASYNNRRWFMLISVYMGQNALFEGDHETALGHFNAAMAVKKQLTAEQDCDFITLQRLIDLTKEHAVYSKTKPEHVHAIQVLYVMHTDLKDTLDAKGKPVIAKGSITESQVNDTIRDHRMMKIYVETLTRGRVTLSFEWKKLDTTLTRAVVYAEKNGGSVFRPDLESLTESLGPILFEGRNKFDTTIYYFNAENFNVWCYANGVPSIYIPYTWYGQSRGSIGFTMDNSTLLKNSAMIARFNHQWVVFHEFFHVIERMSGGISPMHAYLKESIGEAKSKFPAWVPDMNPSWTATEYSWYRYQILNTVPAQMEKKAAETGLYPPFRNFGFRLHDPDRTEEYVYRVYTRAVKDVSPEKLRRAAELLEQGYAARRQKKNDEAQRLFKNALEYNPCHHRVLLELGWAAMNAKDYPEADHYFSALSEVYPDPKELFSIGKSFFDRGEPALAAKYFHKTADLPWRKPVYTRWLARALFSAGERDDAQEAFNRVESNPVMEAPIAYITSNGSGQALFTAANPEDEPSPGLAGPRRQDGCRWKLIPSGGRDLFLIVSDYNWQCLKARGAEGRFSVIQGEIEETDAARWRLVRGADGLYRIISKLSGTPLAVTIPGEGTKPALTLRDDGDTHRYWEIEQLDSALNRMDFERTVGIFSALNDRAIDLYAGKTHDGAEINLWPRTGNSNQWWTLLPSDENGYVYIVARNSWKCLSVKEDAGRIGTVQAGITGGDAQKWKVVPRGEGACLLINKEFDRALEVDPRQPNKLLRLGEIDESEAQLWKLEYR